MPSLNELGGSYKLTQANQTGKLFTPLAEDKLVLRRFDSSEGLSELFEYRIDALSDDSSIQFGPLLGQGFCVEFELPSGKKRYFNGMLAEAQWMGAFNEAYAYRLVLRPRLWLLGRKADCRIFKEQSARDLVKQSAASIGLPVQDLLSGEYVNFEYCVQYRETELAFLLRLMEEYGIYYYFQHTKDEHKLVLADAPSGHSSIGNVEYIPLTNSDRKTDEVLYSWTAETRLRTGKVSLADYDYLKPRRDLLTNKEAAATGRPVEQQLSVLDYPGRYNFDRDSDAQRTSMGHRGELLTKVKLEADQALAQRKYAAGNVASLFPGAAFALTKHFSDNAEYIVVRATHSFQALDYRSGGEGGDSDTVPHGHYEFQLKELQFRAPQVTPKPRIFGPQTAFVVDSKGNSKDANGKDNSEEIDVDKQGRIWVQFHWSRHFHGDEFSLPVRVAQMWSGPGWGWQVIPRIGQEVVVNFIEGDPDQPLVTGTVYNDSYKYPYKLPDHKTISGVKTDSSKGHNGFNELYFEDKKSEEKIRVTAEKDLESVIQNLETREIGVNFKDGTKEHDKPSRQTKLLNGSDWFKVEYGDWKSWLTKGNWTQELTDGNWKAELKKGDWDVKLSLGNATIDVTGKVLIKATQEIKLEVGSSSITITPFEIKVNAAIGLELKGGLTSKLEGGAMTDVKGGAMVTVKGGIVMIN